MKNYAKITLLALSWCLICSDQSTAAAPAIVCPNKKGNAALVESTLALSKGAPLICTYADNTTTTIPCPAYRMLLAFENWTSGSSTAPRVCKAVNNRDCALTCGNQQ